jgi:long-subunit acyl-CoA synthetase (AMP-forming)
MRRSTPPWDRERRDRTPDNHSGRGVSRPQWKTAETPRRPRASCRSAAVDGANARRARVAQINRFAILADEWQPDSDELTPTMKLKRRPITHKYASHIDTLYPTKETR